MKHKTRMKIKNQIKNEKVAKERQKRLFKEMRESAERERNNDKTNGFL